MATLTVKNIPDEIYELLKIVAQKNRRSINNEIIHCIEKSVKSSKIEPQKFIQEIEQFYKNVNIPLLVEEDLIKYKTEGRK